MLTRRFLIAGAASLAAAPALALTEEEALPSVRAEIDTACGQTEIHERFLAEAESMLGRDLSEDERRKLLSAVTCPLCGCSVTAGLF